MNQSNQTGMNRTGIQMSPQDSRAMQNFDGAQPDARFDDTAIADLRSEYILRADLLGSVPLPLAVKSGGKAVAALLNGDSQHMLLDKLGERLAFERMAARLYDALITKCEAMSDSAIGMDITDLQEIRDDEARHFLLVAEAIESLGGDATSQTPSADLAGVESMGLVQVLADPRTTVAQSLHAILNAELADQIGWGTLIMLAEEHGQNDMASNFAIALDEEHDHLMKVQTWYEISIGIYSSRDEAGDELDELPP